MKRLSLIIGILLLIPLLACNAPTNTIEPTKATEVPYWYAPNYPEMMEPKLGENLNYFDWGFLLPDEEEKLIASGDGWEAYSRGDFKDYSVLFALSDRGIHHPDWQDRLVEVYPDHVDEIVMQEKPRLFTMDTRKYTDGTYSYSDYKTGIFHVDSNGKILHSYLDENNGHESEIIDYHPEDHSLDRILGYSFETGIARIVDWNGTIYWEWDQNKFIEDFNISNYSNLEFHYGTRFDEQGNSIPHVYDPVYVVQQNQEDGGIGLNRVQILPDHHKLLSLRNVDLVIELDENDNVVWSYGPMILRHQHCPTVLNNNNVLIHDTGNNRVLEVTRDHKIVFEFNAGMVCPYMGMVQKLPDQTIVFTDGLRTTATCVTPSGKVLWEVYIKGKDTLTRTEALEFVPKVLPGFRIFRAWCYPIEGSH